MDIPNEMMSALFLGNNHCNEEDECSSPCMNSVTCEGSSPEDSEMLDESSSSCKKSRRRRNPGFLLISGSRMYTEDISDGENDMYSCSSMDDGSVDSYCSLICSDSSCDDSYIDDVAEDYIEGIGGSDVILDTKWLAEATLDDGDNIRDSDDHNVFSETGPGIGKKNMDVDSMIEASRNYGGIRSCSSKKFHKRLWIQNKGNLSHYADTLLNESELYSGRRGSDRRLPQFPLFETPRNKHSLSFPGSRKKYQREKVLRKRREKLKHHGVDLREINSKLNQLVLDEDDALSFSTILKRDFSQVQKLASFYHLHSGCQGSGRKRIITVTRTHKTSLPHSSDMLRLKKLIGLDDDGQDFRASSVPNMGLSKNGRELSARHTKGGLISPLKPLYWNVSPLSSSKQQIKEKKSAGQQKQAGVEKKKKKSVEEKVLGEKTINQCNKNRGIHLLPFISNGVMQEGDMGPDQKSSGVVAECHKLGGFEAHTKGFGSRMMAKMGFVQGGGLGKDGQGVVLPLEVRIRPKSLGLGMVFPATDPQTHPHPLTACLHKWEKKACIPS